MSAIECMDCYTINQYNNCNPASLINIDGYFYISYPTMCAVLRFNSYFELESKIPVNGSYYAMCYDAKQNCIYALDIYFPKSIFVLNTDFCEIERIPITTFRGLLPISIACQNGWIYLGFENSIQCMQSKHSQIVYKTFKYPIQAISASCNEITVLVCKEDDYEMLMLDADGQCLKSKEFCLKDPVYAFTIVDSCLFMLTENANQTFCILKYPLCIHEKKACDFDHGEFLFDCGEVEKGIACLLNSEGMKIQYAIEQKASIEDLLKINQSVTCVVNELTQLELALYTRLEHMICVDLNCDEAKDC